MCVCLCLYVCKRERSQGCGYMSNSPFDIRNVDERQTNESKGRTCKNVKFNGTISTQQRL